MKEILGDLWQRMDVLFLHEGSNAQEEVQAVRLVFPEHYEEAVENTPARILFTQHHGTGNNYRQCFYGREMDFRKYDSIFSLAVAQEKPEVLADMVFSRLTGPCGLTAEHRAIYEAYVRNHPRDAARYLPFPLPGSDRASWICHQARITLSSAASSSAGPDSSRSRP